MSYDNTCTISGNCGGDISLRFTPSGQAVANFGVAVSRRWKNKQTDQFEEATSWVDVVAWGQLAENVTETVGKGTRVTVTGRLEQRTWEATNSATGEPAGTRSKIELVADDVAVSLRFATADVKRNERSDGEGGKAPAKKGAAPSYNPDEEPFVVDAGQWMPGQFGEYPERMLP